MARSKAMIQDLKTAVYALTALTAGLVLLAALCTPSYRTLVFRRFVPAIVVTQSLAFLAPTLWLFHVLAAAAVPLFARERSLVAPVYLFLLLTLPGLEGELHMGGVYIITSGLGTSLGIGAVIGMAIFRSAGTRNALRFDTLIAVLWLLSVITVARETSLTNYLRVAADQALVLVLPYLIVSRTVRTARGLRLAFFALIAATLALSSLAIFEALRTWPIYGAAYQHFGISRGIGDGAKMRAGFLRAPGPFAEATSFGLFLALGFLSTCGGRRFFASRTGWLVGLGLPALGLLAPQSRGAWLGAVVGLLALTWYRRDWGGLVKQVGAAAVLSAGAVVASFASGAVATLFESYDRLAVKTDYRSDLLRRGLEEFWKHPVLGESSAAVFRALEDLRQGEQIIDFVNTYLYVALIGGGVGLAFYLLVMLVPLGGALGARTKSKASDQPLGAVAFAMLVSVLVMLAFTSQSGKTTFMIVFLIAILGQSSALEGDRRSSRRNPATGVVSVGERAR